MAESKNTTAKRESVAYRYDVLDPHFLHAMAEIGALGAKKYGDFNYQKSRLTGDASPINHMYIHLYQYKIGIKHDYFETRKHQLAAVAFNAMMEFYYLENLDGE